jgi:hypothetical protein
MTGTTHRCPRIGTRRTAAFSSLLAAALAFLVLAPAALGLTAGPAAAANVPITATLSIRPGPLYLASPASFSWSAEVTGRDQQVVRPEFLTVVDATGSGDGWHVLASASQLAANGGGTVSNGGGTVSVNGSTFSAAAVQAPAAACGPGSTCTPLRTDIAYPEGITSSPVTIMNALPGTGLGTIVTGVDWWVSMPSAVQPGEYTAVILLQLISGP